MDSNPSSYYDEESLVAAVARGEHRNVIGGMWDEIGDLQLAFLQARGLVPQNRLLDIGCGSLRLGVRAVEFLDSGNYWGTDLSPALLEAGYQREVVPLGLTAKLPRTNLVVDEKFDFPGIPAEIDFVIAQSVFTHLPLGHLRECLAKLADHVVTPCTFFFTVFVPPLGLSANESHAQPKGGKVTHPDRDPFHHAIEDLQSLSAGTSWSIDFIGDWNHPRNQMMVRALKP